MSNDNYDIDSILSEVRKRRETLNNPPEEKPAEEAKPSEQLESLEEVVEEPEEQTETVAQEEAYEETEITEAAPPEETAASDEEATPDEEEITEVTEEMIDLFSIGNDDAVDDENEDEEYEEQPERVKFFSTKKGKIVKIVIICLVILILAVGVFGGIYIYRQISNMTNTPEQSQVQSDEWQGMGKLVESFPVINETEAGELASYQDFVKTWYYNGDPCSSTHILNVLLLGEDTRGTNIIEEGTRADSAIIVSINIDTGQITLTSVLRDAYAYWESTPGDPSTGMFGKLNGSMNLNGGNIHTYINAVERLYKVNIDNYVIVNFDSFKKIIDAMGGVELELTTYEIYEINNHPKRYHNVYIEKDFEGEKGTMLLDGSQALAYCRIRYIDGDQFRADRQKTTLMTIFEKARKENTATLLKMINALMPYVKTGFSTKNVVSIAKYAFTKGWMNYDVRTTSVPHARLDEIDDDKHYGEWVWRPDYVQDSHFLQMLIYGKSGITLAQLRPDVARCESFGLSSEGSYPLTATIQNPAYGEPTTYEEMTTEPQSEASDNKTE